MKFPRNARIFTGHLDAAPFVSVLFLLVIFVVLGSLVYTPGVHIQLPSSVAGLPGVDSKGPMVAVAVDANGQLYFENQVIQQEQLRLRLREIAARSREPLTLVVQADKAAKYETCVALAELARTVGIKEALLQTLPRVYDSTGGATP